MKKLKEKLNAKLSKNGGFTLIEMLIVVAIIAILIAVSIPMVNGALEKARNATDSANLRAAKAEAALIYMGAAETDETTGFLSTYVPGSEIKETDKVYYNIDAGKLTTTEPDAYGKCRGSGASDCETGGHVGKVIVIIVDAKGNITPKWTAHS